LHRALKSLFIAAAALGLAYPALAETGDCGTLIFPTGIGITSGADITGFNPLLSNSLYNAEAADLMFQPLLWVNGNTLQIDWPHSIASSVTSLDNSTTYDVKMRSWVWSDGVPVTSADVAYTWKLIQQFGTTYSGYGAGGMPDIVKQFKIIGPEEFQVVLKHQVNSQWFIMDGLGQFQPFPEHVWGKYTSDEIYQHQSDVNFFQVVDGPLIPAKLNVGQDMVFTPNPHWPGGKLHFDRLIFKFVESDGQTVEQLESGELDMINAPMGLWNALQHVPGTHIVRLAPALGYNEIQLNLRNPKVSFFRDVRVREAIADAIDQKQMIQLINHGLGEEHWEPVDSIPPTFLPPAMKQGIYPVGYNPAHALELLKEAGYTRGPDGIMQKNGKTLSFTYLNLTGDTMIEQMTVMNQAYLRRIGIDMKVRDIEFNQMLALLNDPHADWEAAGLGESAVGYPSGEDLFKPGSFGNAGGYSDPTMDKLIDESTNQPGLQGLYDYETYASAQQPVIFQETSSIPLLVNNKIQGAENFIDPLYNYYFENLSCPVPVAEAAK